jgi:tetratricopeptide (TPR) repeat protein
MFTDVVGFTSVMERSEEEAMVILQRKMTVVRNVVSSGGGRLVKEMGDGTLCVFTSSADAVATAVNIQNSLENDSFRIRIGIHCGSVLFEGDDIFGDTVNVASRLEQKAPEGGILLSGEVLSCIPERFRHLTVNLGLTRLKGLGRLLQIHFLGSSTEPRIAVAEDVPGIRTGPLVLSVFPLQNTGKPGDEFYAYGISVDLLSDLSRTDSISIVPVTSLLKAMESGESNEKIAGKFDSSFLLRGSVTRTGRKMKLSVTLKEVSSDTVIWSDEWTEEIEDLPLIKGKIADSVLKALGMNPENYPGISNIEVKSVSVYEKYLQAIHLWEKKENTEHVLQTRKLLKQVIKSEPMMIPARVLLSTTYTETGDYSRGLSIINKASRIATEENNQAGLLLTLRSLGILHWSRGELTEARAAYNKAMTLARELRYRTEEASLLNNIGLIDCDRSLFSQALVKLEKSFSMSKNLGLITGQAHSLCNIGLVYWKIGNGVKALEYYDKSLYLVKIMEDKSGEANLLTNMGIVYHQRGELERAYETASQSMKLSRSLNNRRAVCRALNNMGSVMLTLGMFSVARQHFDEAFSIAQLIGVRNMEGLLLTNKAILIMLTEDYIEASAIFRSSMKIAEEVDDMEGIIENSKYLAEIMLEQNKTTLAEEMIRSALNTSVKFGLLRDIAELETDMALVLIRRKTPYKEVIEQLRKAQTIRVENKDSLPDIHWKWSEICRELAGNQSVPSEEALRLRRESEKWRNASRNGILRVVEKIKSDKLKNSYMHKIPLHHRILTATS